MRDEQLQYLPPHSGHLQWSSGVLFRHPRPDTVRSVLPSMASRPAFLLGLLLLLGATPVRAERAGVGAAVASAGQPADRSAKLTQIHTSGTQSVIAISASFAGEAPGDALAPSWASGLFDPDSPGSVSHFYEDMSFGKLAVRGEAAPRRYASEQPSAAYLARDATSLGKSGRFALEILRKADVDIDFSRFDNDGPDGLPNSGDDDGVVDAVVLMLRSVPARFLVGPATGRANLGDATDPFDGVTYTAFTPDTNPAATSESGARSVRVQGIRMVGGAALMTVETAPRAAEVTQVQVSDEDGNGLLFSGEEVAITPSVTNSGGLELRGLTVRLCSDDPHLEILTDQVRLGALRIGEEASAAIDGRRLSFRFTGGFVGMRESRLFLDLSADGEEVGVHELSVTGYSPRQLVQSITVIDSAGNGDGLVQAGEFIRLNLELEAPDATLDSLELWRLRMALRALDFSLRPASKDAALIGSTRLAVDADAHRVWSATTPEFLLSADLEPGSGVPFQFRVASLHSEWADTLTMGVSEGGDGTPPRVLGLWTRPAGDGVALSLPGSHVLEGGDSRGCTVCSWAR